MRKPFVFFVAKATWLWTMACVAAVSYVLWVPASNAAFRDPLKLNFQQLYERSDLVLICHALEKKRSPRFTDLDPQQFEEIVVTVNALTVLKGELERNQKADIVIYESKGKGMPGNFGSTLKFPEKDDGSRYLLFLRKRQDTWAPTNGYIDGGNSQFLLTCSGFCE